MSTTVKLLVTCIALLGVGPCPLEGGDVDRSLLTYMDLMHGFDFTSPQRENAVALPAEGGFPFHSFQGRLELHDEATSGGENILILSQPSAKRTKSVPSARQRLLLLKIYP